MGSSIYGFITIVFILLCLWFLAFIMTKFIGNKSKSAMRSKYMRVVDTMAIGFDKTLYLVKVGEQYILMHSSAKGFEYICSLNNNLLNVDSEDYQMSQESSKGFAKYLDFFKPSADIKESKEDKKVDSKDKQNTNQHKQVSTEKKKKNKEKGR